MAFIYNYLAQIERPCIIVFIVLLVVNYCIIVIRLYLLPTERKDTFPAQLRLVCSVNVFILKRSGPCEV